jgi:type III restriction enzyme, res subunit superfamily|nr:MAG TPA: Helicase of the snf2 rad54 family [Caudoviricetes sp.]
MKLYKYQQELIDNSQKNYIYPLDTGTGKTIISINHYWKHAQGKKLLIVAPAQKVREGGWDREIKKFKDYNKIDNIDYKVISYHKLADAKVDKNTFIIFDECHYIKNYKGTQRSRFALTHSRKADGFCLLSATPASNGYQDLGNYFSLFGFYTSGYKYEKEFAVKRFNNIGFWEIKEWNNTDKIDEMWKSISSKALMKEDCVDLPPLTFEEKYFDAGKEYITIKKDRYYNGILYDNTSKVIAGLRQSAGIKYKLEYLKEFRANTEANILIFYNFNREAREIKKIIKVDYEVSGAVSSIPNFDEYDTLKGKTTLVQIQAGGAGIELQYNTEVIFFSPTWSYQDYSQALGRAYRIGQKNKVTVYKYIGNRTIEERVYARLDEKQDFAEKLLTDEDLGGTFDDK